MADIAELIAKSHGNKAAEEFRRFEPSQYDCQSLRESGRSQIVFNPIPGACMAMTAFLVGRLQPLTTYVIAGNLSVGSVKGIFGDTERVVARNCGRRLGQDPQKAEAVPVHSPYASP
jgi:hypothetical protein